MWKNNGLRNPTPLGIRKCESAPPDSKQRYIMNTKTPKPKPLIFCYHCGQEFTPYRSTAKFCSTNCRVLAHQKLQREEAKKQHKREAKNARTRLVRKMQRQWKKMDEIEQELQALIMYANMDASEGEPGNEFEAEAQRLKDRLAWMRRLHRIERSRIEREAEENRISMDLIRRGL